MITFEGRQFERRVDFERQFPIYRSHFEMVRGGATTILELERRIAQAKVAQRVANKAAITRNNSQPRCMRRSQR